MSSFRILTILAAGAFAIAALSIPSFAGTPRDRTVVTTELSAENKPDDKNKKVVPKSTPAPARAAPRVIERHSGPPPGAQKNFQVKKNIEVKKNFEVKKNIDVKKKFEGQKKIEVQKNIGAQQTIKVQKFSGKPKVFTPHGKNAGIVITSKIRGAPASGAFHTSIRGRNYSLWRSGYRARYGGGWRTFVALGALGVITIGAAEYYPYAYIDAPADYCDGMTEDGCQMVYDEVQTEEGDVVPQCVAYCPWQQ
jgi:hypothetical protein